MDASSLWNPSRPIEGPNSARSFVESPGASHNRRMQVDVLIAGGGPAGLEAASAVASRGWTAMVLEQDSEIGSPTRTSGGTFVRDMVEFGIPERLYHKVTKCRFFSP